MRVFQCVNVAAAYDRVSEKHWQFKFLYYIQKAWRYKGDKIGCYVSPRNFLFFAKKYSIMEKYFVKFVLLIIDS